MCACSEFRCLKGGFNLANNMFGKSAPLAQPNVLIMQLLYRRHN